MAILFAKSTCPASVGMVKNKKDALSFHLSCTQNHLSGRDRTSRLFMACYFSFWWIYRVSANWVCMADFLIPFLLWFRKFVFSGHALGTLVLHLCVIKMY